jgi:hypothetical protein
MDHNAVRYKKVFKVIQVNFFGQKHEISFNNHVYLFTEYHSPAFPIAAQCSLLTQVQYTPKDGKQC